MHLKLPQVFFSLVPRASQHGLLRPHALKHFVESNLNVKDFHEINRTTARAGTASGTNGIITFGGKDLEATLQLYFIYLRFRILNQMEYYF